MLTLRQDDAGLENFSGARKSDNTGAVNSLNTHYVCLRCALPGGVQHWVCCSTYSRKNIKFLAFYLLLNVSSIATPDKFLFINYPLNDIT